MENSKDTQNEETKNKKGKGSEPKTEEITKGNEEKLEINSKEDSQANSKEVDSKKSSPKAEKPTKKNENILIPCTVIYKGHIYLSSQMDEVPREYLEAMKAKLKRLRKGRCKNGIS